MTTCGALSVPIMSIWHFYFNIDGRHFIGQEPCCILQSISTKLYLIDAPLLSHKSMGFIWWEQNLGSIILLLLAWCTHDILEHIMLRVCCIDISLYFITDASQLDIEKLSLWSAVINSSPPSVAYIYASVNWVSIGSGNGLSPVWRQAIT